MDGTTSSALPSSAFRNTLSALEGSRSARYPRTATVSMVYRSFSFNTPLSSDFAYESGGFLQVNFLSHESPETSHGIHSMLQQYPLVRRNHQNLLTLLQTKPIPQVLRDRYLTLRGHLRLVRQ